MIQRKILHACGAIIFVLFFLSFFTFINKMLFDRISKLKIHIYRYTQYLHSFVRYVVWLSCISFTSECHLGTCIVIELLSCISFSSHRISFVIRSFILISKVTHDLWIQYDNKYVAHFISHSTWSIGILCLLPLD